MNQEQRQAYEWAKSQNYQLAFNMAFIKMRRKTLAFRRGECQLSADETGGGGKK